MSNDEEKLVVKKEKPKDAWLIRPCDVYYGNYKDCRSFRARFHQYFVDGDMHDCTPWRRDYDNCVKWEENEDIKAANEIIDNEKQRRFIRLKGHYGNTVWTKRKEPPADWNSPLPEYMQEEYENSYLNIKNKEMKGEIEPVLDPKCCIM